MKDQDMSCEKLYYAYDFSEKQQRKWLVKIARHWLKKSINKEANKISNDTLEVVESYIRGKATQKELEDAHASASAARVATAYASDAPASAAWFAACAVAAAAFPSVAAASDAYAFAATYAATYKEALLEVINEMDELERLIRKKS